LNAAEAHQVRQQSNGGKNLNYVKGHLSLAAHHNAPAAEAKTKGK
jgi:hypothetical protein